MLQRYTIFRREKSICWHFFEVNSHNNLFVCLEDVYLNSFLLRNTPIANRRERGVYLVSISQAASTKLRVVFIMMYYRGRSDGAKM